MTQVEDSVLHTIFSTVLAIGFIHYNEDIKTKANEITEATIKLYKRVLIKLPPTPTKSHYTFNLRDIFNIFRGILNSSSNRLVEIVMLYRLWIHESLRIFSDRMINDTDANTLKELICEVM
jgi:dynein heavy chain